MARSREFISIAALAVLLWMGILFAHAAAQDHFPVTIEHALGETTIPAAPTRIVTIGWMSQDTVLALGTVPVGIPDVGAWGGDNDGYYPWVKARVEELGQELPAKLNYDDGIPFEDILALEPDLILARYSGLTPEEYQRLSTIAPTVAYAGERWSGEWRDITRTVGGAMGQSAAAEELVEEAEALIAQYRDAHPEFADHSFLFAGNLAEGADRMPVYVSTDPRVQLMQDLGLTLAPGVAALPTDQGFNIPVSLENLDSVEADLLLVWHPDEAGAAYLATNPIFARFGPVAEGKVISIVDRSFVMATSAPSPLSLPYALEQLVPWLEEELTE